MRETAGLTVSLALLLVLRNAPAALGQGVTSLPRTLQTTSFFTGDDGDIQAGVAWPEPRFTPVGDGTMADNLTGLLWPVDAKTPGPPACSPGTTRQWQPALDLVACLNANGYLGHTDWRLPNINELASLWYYKAGNPFTWLGAQGFINVQGTSYWSSTTLASDAASAWNLRTTGPVGFNEKAYALWVWPVRGATTGPAKVAKSGQTTSYAAGDDGAIQAGEPWPEPRFVTSSDCVADRLTGLQWPKAPDPTVRSWEEALRYANGLTLCGFSDWRLPNVPELASLQHFGVDEPATWLATQGFQGLQLEMYWTSTTHFSSTDMGWTVKLWRHAKLVDYLSWYKTYRGYLLPVRTGGAASASAILTVEKAGAGSGVVTSGDSLINCGTTCSKRYTAPIAVTLTATPDPGSTFAGWGGAADCSDGQVSLGADTTCVATFDPPPATLPLTVSRGGTGSGTVRTADGGVECGATCSALYAPGAAVTLVAIPALGSQLESWGGDADCADGLLTMDAGKACTATFTRLTVQQTTRLPRTGQTSTYYGEDDGAVRAGMAWPSPRFVVRGECATDQLTGLVWLRNPDAVNRTWTSALSWASNLSACGHTDWRVPNANELESVLTSSDEERTWLASCGLSVGTGTYWSSTSSSMLPENAFKLGTGKNLADRASDGNSWLRLGRKVTNGVAEVKMVWPVRGTATGPLMPPRTGQTSCYDMDGNAVACPGTGQDGEAQAGAPWPVERFTARGDCIVDTSSGLMWPANANLYSLTPGSDDRVGWSIAMDRARDLDLCGHTDWRLPNRHELWSLGNRGTADWLAWATSQGFRNLVDCTCFWSSTTNPYATADAVSFYPPEIIESIWQDKSFYSCDAWPVRTAAFTLTTQREGNGSGTVSSGEGGIACGADCSEPYLVATTVTLAAAAAAGSTFVGWGGDPDCADGLVTIEDDTTCTAVFLLTQTGQPLAVSLSGDGTGKVTSTPAGTDCGSTCSAWFPSGSTVTLTASPTGSSTFGGWWGACSGTGPCQVVLDRPRLVGATFGSGCAAGDVNCDGIVNVQDVFYLINHLFAGGPAPIGPADVNADGEPNVQDVFHLINFLFAGGPGPV